MGSFTTEHDFEHGEWIDGEFYATAALGQTKRKRTKEDNLYGVFGEDGSSDDERREERRFGRKGQPLRTAPSFVKSATLVNDDAKKPPPPPPPPDAQVAAGPAPKSMDNAAFSSMLGRAAEQTGRGGLGAAGAGGMAGLGAGAAGAAPAQPSGASGKNQEKVDKEYATFEQHTKGFGAKMLAKMGWTKGQALGPSDKPGILNPVEAKLRPTGLGLGYGGFKETTTKAKAQQKRILHGSDDLPPDSDEEAEAAAQRGGAGKPKVEPRPQYWKKGEKRQLKIKGAAELRAEWKMAEQTEAAGGAGGTAGAGAGTVLDMRGPQVRVHGSMHGVLASDAAQPAAPEPTILPELRHNLRMLIDLAEVELGKKQRKLRLERDALQQLTERRDKQAAAARQGSAQLARLEETRDAVAACIACAKQASKKAAAAAAAAGGGGGGGGGGGEDGGGGGGGEDDAGGAALAELARRWGALRSAHPDEFAQWQLHQTAASLVLPPLRRHFARWQPLRQPRFGAALVRAWQDALWPRGGGAPPPAGSEAAYGALVYSAVLPPLRSALANEWQVVESDGATALLEAWRPLLPPAILAEMLGTQVLPRLEAQLGRYAPRTDAPPHRWLHPWLPLLPTPGLAPLFPALRHKLAAAIADAPPDDPAAKAAVAPWRTVFDAGSWAALVNRHVLPKLAHALGELVVNPAAQELAPLEAVLAWADVLSAEQLYTLLARGFFPAWLRTLHAWLDQQPDYQQVSDWYLGWKELFGKRAPQLLRHPGVREQLNAALAALSDALADDAPPPPDGDDDGDAPPPPPPPPGDDDGALDGAPLPPPPAAPGTHGHSHWAATDDGDQLSLRETLERLAAQHDLVFLPTGAQHEGKKLHRFGGVPLYFDPDKKLIYARLDQHGFKPVGIRALLEAAKPA